MASINWYAMGKLQFRISSWMYYRAIKFQSFAKKLPENFTRTNYRPSSSHTVQREKDVGWIIIFLFWFIDGFYESFRFDWITEWNHLRIEKKVEWSSVQEWEFIGTSSLKPKKKRTEWKKEVIDTFWLFSQSTELKQFLFLKRNNIK